MSARFASEHNGRRPRVVASLAALTLVAAVTVSATASGSWAAMEVPEPAPSEEPTALPTEPESDTTPEQPESDAGEAAEEGEEASAPSPLESDTDALEDHDLTLETLANAPLAAADVLRLAAWSEKPNRRLSGANRFATSAAVTKDAYRATAETVIIASGEDFPDALSAAALSAKLRAPLLTVERARIPEETRTELQRLKPARVIIVGGPGVVAANVENSLSRIARERTERVYGNDRYATSAAVSKFGWPKGSDAVFVATGVDYADALAAGAAAGKLGIPVLLVPGSDRSLAKVSVDELNRLKTKQLHVAGGNASISSAIESQLARGNSGVRSVKRYAGKDRFETAAKIVSGVFGTGYADTYWANGYGFPDALAGASAAGARGAALLLVEQDCVPAVAYAANDKLSPGETTLLGGTGVLTDKVRHGNECRTKPTSTSKSDWDANQALYSTVNSARFSRGLAGLRVSDGVRGTPAQAWASQVAQSAAKNQPGLTTAEPWVRYQASAVTSVTKNPAQRLFKLIEANRGAAQWIYQPNAGTRGFVSIGYKSNGSKRAAVLFVGAALDK